MYRRSFLYSLLRPVLWVVGVLVLCTWALRWAYEQLVPLLPVLVPVALLIVIARIWLWRRQRW